MKVVALVAALWIGGSYIDNHYYHGKHSRAAFSLGQQVVQFFGLRR